MNRFHKSISLTLAALLFASGATMAGARSFDDVGADHTAKTEISILSDIGVIKGTGEDVFSPEDSVSREQMAAFLFRLMLGRDDAGRTNTTSFTDLYEPYYHGAISWAHAAGYILGTSKTTFSPTGGIKKQDAMTMLVRALGQDSDKMNEGYPWSYINAGVKLGLDRGLEKIAYEDTLTRAQTAVLLYNALTSEYLVGRTTANGNIYYESTSIIEEVFGYSMTEAVLVSTNDYTTEDNTVVKNGYVTLLCKTDGKTFRMTVPYAGMNLDGDANDYLGHSFRLIYNTESGKHTVLSAIPMSEEKHYDSVKVDEEKKTVTIGENKYTLVKEYSDELSTNNNELMLYAYDADGTLTLVEDIAALQKLLGFYRVTLLHDDKSDTAKRGLLRTFEMDVLDVNKKGEVNLADGRKEEELHISNPDQAKNGDYVLYYYNEKTAELEIAEVLELVSGTVRRITGSTVKIGDHLYDLGNETAGITASSLKEKLQLGSSTTAVLHQNRVVAIAEGVSVSDASRYLLTLSDAHRIYENGSFRYVLTAFIDGEKKNVYVRDDAAKEGNVYRYTEKAGVYTLLAPTVEDGIILSGKTEFIQHQDGLNEIAHIIEKADKTTIELGGRNYYTLRPGQADVLTSVAGLDEIRFVCDKNTMLVVNDGGTLMYRSGAYSSTMTIHDGARVVAVFDNEIGSVETLRYLYISDGSLGNYDLDASFVRILAENGDVYEDGTAYTEYLVYNFASGKIETMLSVHDDLRTGEDYRRGTDDTITKDKADVVMTGMVSGYTSGTVSIDGTAYTFGRDFRAIRITADHKVEEVRLSDLYMTNVEFIADKGEITLVMASSEAVFTAEASGKTVTLTPDFDLEPFAENKLALQKLTDGKQELSLHGATIRIGAKNTVDVQLAEELAAGDYELTFTFGDKTFTAAFTVKQAEVPETPDKPETDKPETDKPETDKPETDNPETDKPETDNPETDKPETDNPETDKPETDNPETDNPETDNPETGKPETDKPETDTPDKPAE